MKKSALSFFLPVAIGMLLPFLAAAQDGSDMLYVKPVKLNTSHVGKRAHLDFGTDWWKQRHVDTVLLEVDTFSFLFTEHREDDGFNNWFNRQYLETYDVGKRLTIRLAYSRIDSVTKDSLLVTDYFEYYDGQNKLVPAKSTAQAHWYPKSELAMVLIKND